MFKSQHNLLARYCIYTPLALTDADTRTNHRNCMVLILLQYYCKLSNDVTV